MNHRKISYRRHFSTDGCSYHQTINITKSEYNSLLSNHKTSIYKGIRIDGMEQYWLNRPLIKVKDTNILFTNLTQRDWICQQLNISKFLNRNTCFKINPD